MTYNDLYIMTKFNTYRHNLSLKSHTVIGRKLKTIIFKIIIKTNLIKIKKKHFIHCLRTKQYITKKIKYTFNLIRDEIRVKISKTNIFIKRIHLNVSNIGNHAVYSEFLCRLFVRCFVEKEC